MNKKYFVVFIFLVVLLLSSCSNNTVDYYTGTVESDIYIVKSELTGRVQNLYVEDGQQINKGEKLFDINVDELKDEYMSLEAQVEGAKYMYENVKSGNRIEEINKMKIQISSSNELIDINKKNMNKALEDLKSYESLYENSAVSLQEVKNMKLNYESQKSSYERAIKDKMVLTEQLSLLEKGSKLDDIRYYEKQYEALQWKLKSMEKRINKGSITSQVDGIIQNTYVKNGELLTSGMDAMKINESNKLWVKIFVEEKNLSIISLGQEIEIKRDNGDLGKGKVYYISPEGEFTPKNLESKESKQEVVFLVKVRIENPDLFKPGMLVDVYIGVDENE